MSTFLASQLFAASAFACGLVSYQFRERRTVLWCLTCLAGFNACHFFLLGQTGSGVIMLLTGVRYVVAIYTQRRVVLFLFLAASLLAFILTRTGPLSALALAGASLGTVGSFQHSDRVMRACFMSGNAVWLLHNILARTPVAIVMEAAFLTSNLLGYWRFFRHKSR